MKDPRTAETACPKGYPYGAKRPPIDTEYYETFNRDNVTLVDISEQPIEAITPTGFRTTDAEFALDVIVFATGFDAMTGSLVRMDIRGPRRARARRRVGGRTAHDARHPDRRVPEPVHDHRSGQPVGAHEHAGRHRAARRLDRRLHRVHARTRLEPHRGHHGGAGRVGGARRRGRPGRRCSPRRTPGTWVRTFPASPGW